MPSIIVPVDNTDSTISRLVAKSIIESLIYYTEIPHIQDIIYIQRGGKALNTQVNAPKEPVKLEIDDYLQVEYMENAIEEHFDMTKYQGEYPAIFNIPKVGVSITPLYKRVYLDLTVTYKAKSYNDLTNWLNSFKRRLLTAEAMFYHDIIYDYNIPDTALAYINQVYKAMEAVSPYGDTLKAYLTKYFATSGLIVRRNLNDSKQQLAMNIKTTNCLGLFTQLPELQETGKEPPISTIGFTYRLIYDRVTDVSLFYQHYVHNQVLDLKLIKPYYDRRPGYINSHQNHLTVTQTVNTVTQDIYSLANYQDPNVAAIDGWRPSTIHHEMVGVLLLPIQLNPTNLFEVLDINELVNFGIPMQLLGYMLQFKNYIFKPYKWFTYIELFEVNDTVGLIPLSIDDNTTLIKTTVQLDLRNRYYLRFSKNYDVTQIDFSLLRNDAVLLEWLFQYLNPSITLNVIGANTVPTESLLNAISIVKGIDYVPNHRWREQRSTLNSFHILRK